MKKTLTIGTFIMALALSSLFAQGESAKKFFIGVNAGAAPIILIYNGYRFGGEIGYRISDRISIMAEVAYGSATYNYDYQGTYLSSSDKTTFSSFPIGLSLHFTAPVNKNFYPYAGVGIAHYSVKITEDYRSTSSWYGPTSESTSYDLSGILPVFKLGIECAIAKNLMVVGEVKIAIGKDKMKDITNYSSSEYDMFFGGTEVKFGFRIYLF